MNDPIPISLPGWPTATARALIAHSVNEELNAYQERQDGTLWLDLPKLKEALEGGEVRHGPRDMVPCPIDPYFAFRAAIEAVEDGIVLMFVDQLRVKSLDLPLSLTTESRVRYVKLTALRGY